MGSTLVDEFLKHDVEHYAKVLGIAVDEFMVDPSVSEASPSWNFVVQIARLGERSAVVSAPDWKERAEGLVRGAPWKEWLDSSDGLDRFLGALGLGHLDMSERPGTPDHNIALLCDAARFRPFDEHADQVVRITPEHPLWNDPDAAPKWPSKYVIVEEGQIIAQVVMKHNLDVLGGRTWALGVAAKPEHRRKGYGKAVVAAATREIVEGGGLALWNAQGSNLASLALCQSLGYEKFFWLFRVPTVVPDNPGAVDG